MLLNLLSFFFFRIFALRWDQQPPIYTYIMPHEISPELPRAETSGEVDTLFDAALDCMVHADAAGAVEYFQRILALDPNHAEANHGLIRALEDTGRIDDALSAVQALIARDPEDVLAQTRLSMIYQHMGRIAEAEAAATKAKILGWKQELRSGIVAKTDL